MKLFTKYSRSIVTATIAIFLIASVAFYFTLHFVLINQIDEDLKIEEREIITYVKKHNRLPESISVKDQVITYKPITSAIKRHFTTGLVRETGDQEKEKFRQLIFSVYDGNQLYQASVSKSLEDTESITRSIFIIAFTTILSILLVVFLLNRIVLKRIWKPFYQSLDAAKKFKVGDQHQLKLPSSDIDEFRAMNVTMERMAGNAQLDYLSLKTFSENASHEIQTPLAIIRSKLDLMIQDENLTEKQSESLQAAYNSIEKLTRLNQSLLLLAKIENNQFSETSAIDLTKEVEEKIFDFQELWLGRQIKVNSNLHQATVNMNKELAGVLLNNLFSNATKHNYSGGKILIELNKHFFEISNTGRQTAIDGKSLFHRFSKASAGGDCNGLGLSIIKEICDNSGFDLKYKFENDRHVFVVSWDKAARI